MRNLAFVAGIPVERAPLRRTHRTDCCFAAYWPFVAAHAAAKLNILFILSDVHALEAIGVYDSWLTNSASAGTSPNAAGSQALSGVEWSDCNVCPY